MSIHFSPRQVVLRQLSFFKRPLSLADKYFIIPYVVVKRKTTENGKFSRNFWTTIGVDMNIAVFYSGEVFFDGFVDEFGGGMGLIK